MRPAVSILILSAAARYFILLRGVIYMRKVLCVAAAAAATFGAARAAEVSIVSYEDGELSLALAGAGTVTVTAQVDFKYISAKTGSESLARAVSEPVKVKLTAEGTPVTLLFPPPEGALVEVEAVVFVNGVEKARETFYY